MCDSALTSGTRNLVLWTQFDQYLKSTEVPATCEAVFTRDRCHFVASMEKLNLKVSHETAEIDFF